MKTISLNELKDRDPRAYAQFLNSIEGYITFRVDEKGRITSNTDDNIGPWGPEVDTVWDPRQDAWVEDDGISESEE